jgi:hypothetical protein
MRAVETPHTRGAVCRAQASRSGLPGGLTMTHAATRCHLTHARPQLARAHAMHLALVYVVCVAFPF